MKQSRFYFGILIFILLGVMSFFLVDHFGNDLLSRNPASIQNQKIFDFSHLAGATLELAMRKQILKGSEGHADGKNFVVQLGHFLMPDGKGHSVNACDIYDLIVVDFEAEGMASSGERPHLSITADCLPSESRQHTQPITVPVEMIQSHAPANFETTLNMGITNFLSTRNIDFSWPRHWVLSEIRFRQRNKAVADFVIDRKEIYQLSSTPVVMYWEMKNSKN